MDGQIEIQGPSVIPDLPRLLEAVYERSPIHASYVHGDQHWRAVAEVGLRLREDTRKADAMVIFLFALFHDSMRENDHVDPGHGRRGAELAEELHGRLYRLSDERLALLIEACSEHTDARFSDDPTLGVCFDSDRLNLWRIGTVPVAKYLSTDLAADDFFQQWTKTLHGHARSRAELLRMYSA